MFGIGWGCKDGVLIRSIRLKSGEGGGSKTTKIWDTTFMNGPLGLEFLLIENNCTIDFKFLLTSFIKDIYLNHISIMHMNYNTARTTYLVKIISSTLREIDLILYSIEQTVKPPLCCLRRLYIHTTHTIQ